jgi:hypothetical protein
MNCFSHPSKSAVGLCTACGCGLCFDCFSVVNRFDRKPVCNACYRAFLLDQLNNIKKERRHSIITILLFGLPGALLLLLTPSNTPEKRMRYKIRTNETADGKHVYVEEDDELLPKIIVGVIFTFIAASIFFLIHLVKLFIYPSKISKIQNQINDLDNQSTPTNVKEKSHDESSSSKANSSLPTDSTLTNDMSYTHSTLISSQITALSKEIMILSNEIANLNRALITSSDLQACQSQTKYKVKEKVYGNYIVHNCGNRRIRR